MREAVESVQKWMSSGQGLPVKMDMFLTQRCNLQCIFCGCHKISHDILDKEIPEKKWLSLVDEAAELGIKTVGILGGEPFTRPKNMIRIMQRIKQNKMCGALTTNGTIFSENIVKQIVDMKWDMLRFSIDGPTAGTHDYLRGVAGCFDSMISSLRLFKKIKKETKSGTPSIEFSTVLCNKNYQELEKIACLAAKFECKKWYILPMIPLTSESDMLKMNTYHISKAKAHLPKTEDILCKHKIESNIRFILENKLGKESKEKLSKPQASIPCYQPWYSLAIHANGSIVPCANFDDSKGENILYNSLKNIWFGEYFKKIRNTVMECKLQDPCSRCCMPTAEENKEIFDGLKKLRE